jgi:hypothetical protein
MDNSAAHMKKRKRRKKKTHDVKLQQQPQDLVPKTGISYPIQVPRTLP